MEEVRNSMVWKGFDELVLKWQWLRLPPLVVLYVIQDFLVIILELVSTSFCKFSFFFSFIPIKKGIVFHMPFGQIQVQIPSNPQFRTDDFRIDWEAILLFTLAY